MNMCFALPHCVKLYNSLYTLHSLDNFTFSDIFNVKTRRLACMLSNLSWDSSSDERNIKLNLPEKGNVLPNQKTHVVCVYFPSTHLNTER